MPCLINTTSTYILLTKREGRTGRISARGLDSTDRVQKRPRADILPVRSRESLVNKRFITRLKKAFKVFHKLRFPSLLLISLVLGVSTAGAGHHHSSCF